MDYRYRAKVINVIDGDTVKLSVRLKRSRAKSVDLGFHVFIEDGWICVHETIRLFGVDAPEKNTDAGKAALKWLRTELPVGLVVDAKTLQDKQEKYGRFLADLWHQGDDTSVNDRLVSTGHARPWDGKGRRP